LKENENLKELLVSKYLNSLNSISTIDTTILPYQARFIADPFIFYKGGEFHILCEVAVKQNDKRIVHLRSFDAIQWNWVKDLLTSDDFSFPKPYQVSCEDELIIIPQVSSAKQVRAYKYNLVTQVVTQLWEKDIKIQSKDLVFIQNPINNKFYLIFGMSQRGRAALGVSSVTGMISLNMRPQSIDYFKLIAKRKFLEGFIGKFVPYRRLTWRPAGEPINIDQNGFCLPIQATKTGKYGEMLALVSIDWNFKVQSIEYISFESYLNNIERVHHISYTYSSYGLFFCFDCIPIGKHNRWELRVVKLYE